MLHVTDFRGEEATARSLFFEIYRNLPRAGPGDADSMRRAFAMMRHLPTRPRVLDVGCGPGWATLELASITGGSVTAFDLHLPFVVRLASAAQTTGVASCVGAVCADMRMAPFMANSFDLVWSEGALYSIGFREGLAVCRDLARPGGYVAATEVVWTVPEPPDEVRRWWEAEYPAIASVNDKAAGVASAGLDLIGHFTLPAQAWLDNYYKPMHARLAELRDAWVHDPIALQVLEVHEHEILMYERFGHTYGYEFFVAARRGGSGPD